jgi:uncharacterized LabA/DUF88 family protein
VALRTSVYVDGFNLYYRALKKTPYRWVNLVELAKAHLDAANQISALNYYTAHVSGKVKSDSPARQQMYVNALETLAGVRVHYGSFLARPKTMPRYPVKNPPTFVEVLKTEEKGSDVNLATHLVFDGCQGRYDVAVVISNDTDLCEPIRVVAQELKMPVGLLSPVDSPAKELTAVSTFVRRIKKSALKSTQFPDAVKVGIEKPQKWRLQDPIFLALELVLTGTHVLAVAKIATLGAPGLQALFGKKLPARIGTAFTALSALSAKVPLDAQDKRTIYDSIQLLADEAARL